MSDNDLDSLDSFIDDNDEIEDDRIFYQKFKNVTSSIDDILKEEYNKSTADIAKLIYIILVRLLKKKKLK